MTNDFGREAMTMVGRDGAHQCSMPHPLVEPASIINLTIPFELVDIKDFNLLLLEPMSPLMGQYTHQQTKDWSVLL
jgi:hypothetical protein